MRIVDGKIVRRDTGCPLVLLSALMLRNHCRSSVLVSSLGREVFEVPKLAPSPRPSRFVRDLAKGLRHRRICSLRISSKRS